VTFPTPHGPLAAVREVSFGVEAGEIFALVGESGSGKSSLLSALAGMLPPGAETAGQAVLAGRNVLTLDARAWRALRGRHLAVVFQESGDALDPTMIVGRQVAEVCALHHHLPARAAWTEARDHLRRVGLAEGVARAYPHQLSGGMRRRALLALALAGEPTILLADEPTAGLDATVAAQVADVLGALSAQRGLTLLLVTHQLGLVARLADRVAVLYAGRMVEQGSAADVLLRPAHPYTQALLAAASPAPGAEERAPRPLPGTAPDPLVPPPGCPFAPRCAWVLPACGSGWPPALPAPDGASGHSVHCWLHTPGAEGRPA
jgi:oligopeptide/dipeptide ABC transporter ATP-binding protein